MYSFLKFFYSPFICPSIFLRQSPPHSLTLSHPKNLPVRRTPKSTPRLSHPLSPPWLAGRLSGDCLLPNEQKSRGKTRRGKEKQGKKKREREKPFDESTAERPWALARAHGRTVGQIDQKPRRRYWASRSFARTAHLFARSRLLALLAPSAALTRSLARSLRSLSHSWESEL